jgi:DMSO/TMAO reductase YedYZ molybdopterin-dependent catalytic subunit
VSGDVATPLTLDLDALEALGSVGQEAVLDCTSGWAMRTTWHGTPLRTVLEAAGADPDARHVVVRSITGWSVALQRDDLEAALLASHVGGQPLPAANGAPVRLVAPQRRGLDWIKWVDRIEVG